jgi:hypothetical protein
MVKKANDLQKANAKLQSELQQKENLISAQGVCVRKRYTERKIIILNS